MEPFGPTLRRLRSQRQLGLKRIAPELGVSPSYLSKVENGQLRPSEDFVYKVAGYFDEDPDRLLLAADRVPREIIRILQEEPDDALTLLREYFARDGR